MRSFELDNSARSSRFTKLMMWPGAGGCLSMIVCGAWMQERRNNYRQEWMLEQHPHWAESTVNAFAVGAMIGLAVGAMVWGVVRLADRVIRTATIQ